MLFFFSSRRRHTSWPRDWSSDVCSSDLFTKNSFKEVVVDGFKSVYHSRSRVETIRPGRATGRLIGGNLTILTTSLGTSYEPDFSGALLFLEDIGERSEEHTSELQSRGHLVCRLLLENTNHIILCEMWR